MGEDDVRGLGIRTETETRSATVRLIAVACGLCLVLFSTSPSSASPGGPPERIVSINLCADQLVLMLAPAGAVKSVSRLAASTQNSPLAEQARGIPVNHARVEDILPHHPDVVFASQFAQQFTQDLLTNLGYDVVAIPQADDFDGIRANVRLVAERLGVREKGEEIVRTFDAALDAARETGDGKTRPLALVLHAGGYTEGGAGLVSDMMNHAGLDNLADKMGVHGWARVPMEAILLGKPDLVVLGAYRDEAPSLKKEQLEHPALAAYVGDRHVVGVASRYWSCSTPLIAEVAGAMARAARQWKAR